jgi:hypothetical protein
MNISKTGRRNAIVSMLVATVGVSLGDNAGAKRKKGGKDSSGSCEGFCSPENPGTGCGCICRQVPQGLNVNNYSRKWGLCIEHGVKLSDLGSHPPRPADCCQNLYCISTGRCGFC